MILRTALLLLLSSGGADTGTADPQLRFAELGRCVTAAGATVLDCRIGFRTAGRLNERRDNAVVIPSWYGGTSAGLLRWLGSDALVDTTKYYVVMIDALGNGVSTAPSTSVRQPGAAFPRLTIADMVDAARRVVLEHLRLERLHAIMGFSMGAHQVLDWAVRYPNDAASWIALAGAPRNAPYDAFVLRSLRWATRLGSELPGDSAFMPLIDVWHVISRTAEAQLRYTGMDLDSLVAVEARGWADFDPYDNLLQLDALLMHDVTAATGGDLSGAAARVRGRMLMVTSPDDRIVTESEAHSFGAAAAAEVLSVPSRCGHFALYCEPVIAQRVGAFLAGG